MAVKGPCHVSTMPGGVNPSFRPEVGMSVEPGPVAAWRRRRSSEPARWERPLPATCTRGRRPSFHRPPLGMGSAVMGVRTRSQSSTTTASSVPLVRTTGPRARRASRRPGARARRALAGKADASRWRGGSTLAAQAARCQPVEEMVGRQPGPEGERDDGGQRGRQQGPHGQPAAPAHAGTPSGGAGRTTGWSSIIRCNAAATTPRPMAAIQIRS